ncbi:hypothetical protein [Caulobacter henricii]|uniref:Uncharacterized protein n=1 Tax=Caulobacter henricii TaxID=69395 RepID=A0A0P0NY87_9CAUL|nr:hypothetical protein [Caulobacter henricii]ALL12617.1 hypothetical protein AQ619_04175 [Caulobacter henricii]
MTEEAKIFTAPPREHWDPDLAHSLIGKTLMLGLTFLDDEGEVLERQQFFGVVIEANDQTGIALDLLGEQDGDIYTLPPQTSAIIPTPQGVTTLSGETPDFVVNWFIHGAPDDAESESEPEA